MNYIANDGDSDRAVEARGILAQLAFSFLLLLNMLSDLLNTTNALSLQLQAKDADLSAAIDLFETLIEDLQ